MAVSNRTHDAIWLTLDDGIDRTALLTVATIDAFGHIDVVASRPSTTIFSLFGLDSDRQRRTDLSMGPLSARPRP